MGVKEVFHHGTDIISNGGNAIESGKTLGSIGATGKETEATLTELQHEQTRIMLLNARLSFMNNCAQCIKDMANHQL
ncbi:hypothetical protein [Mycetohabitans endofungorum]|uniref:hypothetical protein n=1 Tax=Mycetohabitans endofungorum TaxID=417203 RepID=UPI002B05C923|nr:hypothetical protein [Mycetohabitans endofungorum]